MKDTDVQDRAVTLWLSGISCREVGQQCGGLCRNTILRWVREAGHDTSSKPNERRAIHALTFPPSQPELAMPPRPRHEPGLSPFPDASQLAEGGRASVTYTAARDGGDPGPQRVLSREDFQETPWMIEQESPRGWEFLGEMPQRPYPTDLRHYGPGLYRVTPIDGRRPVVNLAETLRIADPQSSMPMHVDRQQPPAPVTVVPTDPAAMLAQLQLDQARDRATRQAEDDRRRTDREDREETAAITRANEAKQERQDRLDREEQERKDRRETETNRRAADDAKWERLLAIGLPLVKSFAERMLAPASATPDAMTALVVQMAKNKAEPAVDPLDRYMNYKLRQRMIRDLDAEDVDPEDKEDGTIGLLREGLSLAASMRGGSAPAAKQLPSGADGKASTMTAAEVAAFIGDHANLTAVIAADPDGVVGSLRALATAHPLLAQGIEEAICEARGGGKPAGGKHKLRAAE